MNITPIKLTVRELVEGYADNGEGGVIGYGGRLDIRPAYQREFIYKDAQREAVISTVKQGFPLNVMYWAKRDGDAAVPYEVMDGQQRTISLCQFVNGDFAHDMRFFNNLAEDEKKKILDYGLMVYICEGTDSEKLKWFETINIAGETLTAQELRNAVYAGPYLADAKRYFSRRNCPAWQRGKDLLAGDLVRQDYLETALRWKCRTEGCSDSADGIARYLAVHQHDANALALWQYMESVFTWVEGTFDVAKRKKIMKGVDWGRLYDRYHEAVLDRASIDSEVARLMLDSEVQKKSGICPYVLTHDERLLNLRAFPEDIALAAYERQDGKCALCGERFDFVFMDADHITPWCEGGKTVAENCQMLCRTCNRRKGAK